MNELSKQETKNIYNTYIKPNHFFIKKDLTTIRMIFIGTISCGFLFLIYIIYTARWTIIFSPIIILITSAIAYMATLNLRERLNLNFRKNILFPFLKTKFSHLSFDAENGIAQSIFENSPFNSFHEYDDENRYLEYRCDQKFYGTIDNVYFEFSQISTFYKFKTDVNNTDIITEFFYRAKTNKKFIADTIVETDTAQKLFGKTFGNWLQNKIIKYVNKINGKFINPDKAITNFDLITFEHQEFEEEFVVYSSNESEARAILSPLIENLLALKKLTRHPINIYFKADEVYVEFRIIPSQFNTNIFGDLLCHKKINLWIETINYFYSIITLLKLYK